MKYCCFLINYVIHKFETTCAIHHYGSYRTGILMADHNERETMEIIYYVASSLDGYIATPDGSVAWLAPFENASEDYGYTRFYDSVDAVLMGSTTYEKTLSFGAWPYEGKPGRVFSAREHPVACPDVVITAADPADVLYSLACSGCRRAWLVGGGVLASSFRQRGLISEYIISIIPVILGGGIPLFAPRGFSNSLNLLESKTYPDGVVQLKYVPVTSSVI